MSDMVHQIRRQYDSGVSSIDEENYELTAVVSTDSVDRYGDSIDQSGWKLGNFLRNPVIPWGHDYDSLPVGKAIRTWVEKGKLLMRIRFAVEEYDFARTVFNLYKEGFLRAFSVGFVPGEYSDERDDAGRWIRKYKSAELLEVSAVTVPANQDALALAVSKGVIRKSEMKKILAKVEKMGEQKDISANARDDRSVEGGGEGDPEMNLGNQREKAEDSSLAFRMTNDMEKILKVNAENHGVMKKYRKSFEQLRRLFLVDPLEDESETIERTMAVVRRVLGVVIERNQKGAFGTGFRTSRNDKGFVPGKTSRAQKIQEEEKTVRPAEQMDLYEVIRLAKEKHDMRLAERQ